MKTLLFLIAIFTTTSLMKSEEPEYLWFKFTNDINGIDFTPDDKFVIAWTNGVELWEVQEGSNDFHIPTEATGDFNYNEDYLIIVQDSTPKLLNWKTREVVEGFEKENQHFGRIKTAKSKNEFMATLGHYPKTIFFWDINQKSILDSFEITKEYKADGYKWERFIREYHYAGINDEYFIIRVSDNNINTDFLHPDDEIDKFSYLIYDRNTKELVDSLFAFNVTKDNYSHVDKLVIMNNRDHLAWNNEGGVINFYDIKNKRFYNKLDFDDKDYIEASDIEINLNDDVIGVSVAPGCCRYIKIFNINSKEQLYQYNIGSWNQLNFSRDNDYFVASISGYLSLYPKHWIISNIQTKEVSYTFKLSPNPSNSYLNIELQLNSLEYVKLEVIDMAGGVKEIIYEGLLDETSFNRQLDISNYSAGAYFIKLEIDNEVVTKQFIKE